MPAVLGCNAVTIRNIFQRLRKHGLIEVKRGAGGGAFLTREPSEITLWEIYCAVEHDGVESLIGIHSSPYEQCPVGKYIQQVLADPYEKSGDSCSARIGAIHFGEDHETIFGAQH